MLSQASQGSLSQSQVEIGCYKLLYTLGEGEFGRVKLGIDQENSEKVAVKIIEKEKSPDRAALQQELDILSMLDHNRVVRYFETVPKGNRLYIVLEFAEGGELFDQIEPDLGVGEAKAQLYFQQLLEGMEYIHGLGICHRDLKPENLLLDSAGGLKISDFGLSTLYLNEENQRIVLTRCCGTPPYVAPEVLTCKYDGPSIDMWSCGVILFVMLVGELPWDEPTQRCPEFAKVANGDTNFPPWTYLPKMALDLILALLSFDYRKRATIPVVKRHPWFVRPLDSSRKRRRDDDDISAMMSSDVSRMRLDSQRVIRRKTSAVTSNDVAEWDNPVQSQADFQKMLNVISCSQPIGFSRTSAMTQSQSLASQPDSYCDLAASSQPVTSVLSDVTNQDSQGEPSGSALPWFDEVVKHRTRFKTHHPPKTVLEYIGSILDELTIDHSEIKPDYKIQVSTIDRRKRMLTCTIRVFRVSHAKGSQPAVFMVDFLRGRGCAMEFKRLYNVIHQQLCTEGLVLM